MAEKYARDPFPKSTKFRASKPFELVYADFFLLIVNIFSRLMWVAILKNNSEAFRAFQKFKTLAESESNGASMKCFKIDCGEEFTSEEFSIWCEEKGFQRQLTTPHTPQKNGVERKNMAVVGLVRSILKDKSLPLKLMVRLSILVCTC